MPGFPPPLDAPPIDEQKATEQLVSLAPSPAGADLCGFAIPGFSFNVTFRLPNPLGDVLDFPPGLNLAVGLKCDIDDPIDLPSGGGRAGTLGLDDDPEFGPDG